MNLLAINQLCSLRWEFLQDAQAYSDAGWDGIGIYRPKLEEVGVDLAVECLADCSLAVTSLSWAGGFTGSDAFTFDEAVQDAILAIRDASTLRAHNLILLAGGRNNHIRKHARRTLLDALAVLVPVAEDFGVRLAIEPFHAGCGSEWSFLNDLESTLDVIETIGNPQLGMVLDTYHVGMDDDVLQWLPIAAPHVNLLQLGDGRHSPLGEMNRCLLGQGCVPLESILHHLLESGYSGPIEAEVIGEDVQPLGYNSVLEHTREFLNRTLAIVRS